MKDEFITIQIKRSVHKDLKIICKRADVKLRKLISEALEGFVENNKKYQEGK